jgi:hypothetical protein
VAKEPLPYDEIERGIKKMIRKFPYPEKSWLGFPFICSNCFSIDLDAMNRVSIVGYLALRW